MSRRGARRARVLAAVVALAWSSPGVAEAAPAPAPAPEPVTLEGRILEAGGTREPVSGAAVLIVGAPADARPGKVARTPLDPGAITWMLRAETDAEGRFAIPEVPAGKLRVVVVAGGYDRLEQWAEVPRDRPLELYLLPERDGEYRTEVATDREQLDPPEHALDGQTARHYAGGGDDPLLVAQNLPGVARSPGGLGLLSLRGGNPTETGYYLDGHPIPRAFHVVPIASVVSPPMVDRVELNPGSYGPGYGSFSGGLVEVFSRGGRLRAPRGGVHGQAHLDLFDIGATLEAPIGPGAIHFGFRRSHVDAVLRAVEGVTGPTGILLPNYWDYLGRLDVPVRAGHVVTLRAIGAGDRLRGRANEFNQTQNLFDFAAAFHRFDLDYRITEPDFRVLISPSLRLDSTRLQQEFLVRRDATVFSGRAEVEADLREWLTIQIGGDVVSEHWRRRERVVGEAGGDLLDADQLERDDQFEGRQLRAGLWLGAKLRYRNLSFVPSLRGNLFDYGGRLLLRFDPRFEFHGRVHPKVETFAKLGLFSIPVVGTNSSSSSNLVNTNGQLFGGVADVPGYLVAYFDPGVDGEVRDRSSAATHAVQASTGVEGELPWDLRARGTLFWREVLPTTLPVFFGDVGLEFDTPRRRSMGVELLLRRALGRRLDGWIGYTLLWSRIEANPRIPAQARLDWIPGVFDQRHNLVVLLSVALPRGFRFGARFRLVSGNPQETVLGGEVVNNSFGWFYRPIRGVRGTTYQPPFHQLDLRLDKRWTLDRVAVTAYLDIQNVYDHRYPEISVYTQDWSQQSALLGLPIYPSFGVQVDY